MISWRKCWSVRCSNTVTGRYQEMSNHVYKKKKKITQTSDTLSHECYTMIRLVDLYLYTFYQNHKSLFHTALGAGPAGAPGSVDARSQTKCSLALRQWPLAPTHPPPPGPVHRGASATRRLQNQQSRPTSTNIPVTAAVKRKRNQT